MWNCFPFVLEWVFIWNREDKKKQSYCRIIVDRFFSENNWVRWNGNGRYKRREKLGDENIDQLTEKWRHSTRSRCLKKGEKMRTESFCELLKRYVKLFKNWRQIGKFYGESRPKIQLWSAGVGRHWNNRKQVKIRDFFRRKSFVGDKSVCPHKNRFSCVFRSTIFCIKIFSVWTVHDRVL